MSDTYNDSYVETGDDTDPATYGDAGYTESGYTDAGYGESGYGDGGVTILRSRSTAPPTPTGPSPSRK